MRPFCQVLNEYAVYTTQQEIKSLTSKEDPPEHLQKQWPTEFFRTLISIKCKTSYTQTVDICIEIYGICTSTESPQ